MTIPSFYELTETLYNVRKQHFIDWFSGDDLKSWWTKTDNVGTNTFAINDTINDGFGITTGANSGDEGCINFNNKRQYNYANSVLIGIVQREATASVLYLGLGSSTTGQNSNDVAMLRNWSTQTFYQLYTKDGVTSSTTDSDIAIDTSYHTHRLDLGASNVKLYIDGVLKVTKTTNRPTVGLQPFFQMATGTTATKKGNIRYCEVYNI